MLDGLPAAALIASSMSRRTRCPPLTHPTTGRNVHSVTDPLTTMLASPDADRAGRHLYYGRPGGEPLALPDGASDGVRDVIVPTRPVVDAVASGAARASLQAEKLGVQARKV